MTVILITGATGKQGGAAIDALLASARSDLEIRALTRNPESTAARKVAARGVAPVKGDLTDRESLLRALQDVELAHLVTDFTSPKGVPGEIEQGKLFVDCAKQCGVSHIVFSSVAGAETREIDHFHSKYIIEQYIEESGLDWTMVRPTGFMENCPPPGIGRFFFLSVMAAIFGQNKVYFISTIDIGKVVAQALLHPEKWRGRIIDLVGDIADVNDFQASLDRAEGYKSWRAWLPRWLVFAIMPHEFKQMFTWLSKTYANNRMPGSLQELKAIVPDALNSEAWARKDKARREAELSKKAV